MEDKYNIFNNDKMWDQDPSSIRDLYGTIREWIQEYDVACLYDIMVYIIQHYDLDARYNMNYEQAMKYEFGLDPRESLFIGYTKEEFKDFRIVKKVTDDAYWSIKAPNPVKLRES